LLTILAASIVYPLMSGVFGSVNEYISEYPSGGSGILSTLVNIQNHFGYFLVLVPKILHLLFGILTRFGHVFAIQDFWDDIVVMFEAVAFLVLLALMLWRKSWRKSHDLLFVMALFCVVFALSPVYSPRYFFPLYPICAMLITLCDHSVLFNLSSAPSQRDSLAA